MAKPRERQSLFNDINEMKNCKKSVLKGLYRTVLLFQRRFIPVGHIRRDYGNAHNLVVLVKAHDPVYVVEMNRDGQLAQILTVEYPEYATRFQSVAFQDGLPAAARWVREGILAKRGGAAAVRAKSNGGAASRRAPKKATQKASARRSPAAKAAKSGRK